MHQITPANLAATKLICAFLSVSLALLRTFLLIRYKPLNVRNIACQALLLCACAFITVATGTAVSGLLKEASMEASGRYTEEEIMAQTFSPTNMKLFVTGHLFYTLGVATLKASFLVFYSTLFTNLPTRKRLAVHFATVFWAAGYSYVLILQLTYCHPISSNWAPLASLPVPRCPAPLQAVVYGSVSTVNIATDVTLLLAPLIAIFSLRLRRPEMVGLVLVFTIGGTAIVFSVLRLAVVWPLLQVSPRRSTGHLVMLFSTLEVFPAVFAFCLPCLRWVKIAREESVGSKYGSKGTEGSVSVGESRGRGKESRDVSVTEREDSETRLTVGGPKGWEELMNMVDKDSNRV